MKKLLFSLIVVSTFFASCGDDCELTDINDIIVGEWTLNGFDVEFLANGTINDPGNLFELEINGIQLNDKSYEIEGDTVLNIKFASVDPPANGSTPHEITSYECDKIVTNYLLPFTFKRK